MGARLGPIGGGLQGNQGTKAVTDECRAVNFQGVEQCPNVTGRSGDRLGRRTRTLAMTRKVKSQDVVAVVGQIPRLQNPHAVVVQNTMDQNGRWLTINPGFAARVDKCGLVLTVD